MRPLAFRTPPLLYSAVDNLDPIKCQPADHLPEKVRPPAPCLNQMKVGTWQTDFQRHAGKTRTRPQIRNDLMRNSDQDLSHGQRRKQVTGGQPQTALR